MANMKIHIETPLIESLSIKHNLQARVWLKMEALQPCGSFKIRGIGFACEKYIAEGAKSLLSSSGGNAGLAVAYSGRQLGVPVTVVVPKTTKKRAIELIVHEGAKVIVIGENWGQAHKHAMSLLQDDVAYIHPFDDANIWEGHASMIDEISNAGVIPDAIVLSVGGGGLLCGVMQGLQRNGWEDIPVLAVETMGAASYAAASEANEHISIDKINSVATSLGATKVAKRAFELLTECHINHHVVTDKEAVNACYQFLDDHRVMVEPACGASLAAIYNNCDFLKDKQNIVVIVCGGVGVTIDQLLHWKQDFSH